MIKARFSERRCRGVLCLFLLFGSLLAVHASAQAPPAILGNYGDPSGLWAFRAPGEAPEPWLDLVGTARIGPLAVESEERLLSFDDQDLVSIDLTTGLMEVRGQVFTDGVPRGIAVLGDGSLWTTIEGNLLTRLDPADGTILFQQVLPMIANILAGEGDRLLAIADDIPRGGWSVYEIDPSDGTSQYLETVDYFDVPGFVIDADLDDQGRLWLVAQDVSLASFGGVLRIPLGGGEVDMLVFWGAGTGQPFFSSVAVPESTSVVDVPTHSTLGLTLLALVLALLGWRFVGRT